MTGTAEKNWSMNRWVHRGIDKGDNKWTQFMFGCVLVYMCESCVKYSPESGGKPKFIQRLGNMKTGG